LLDFGLARSSQAVNGKKLGSGFSLKRIAPNRVSKEFWDGEKGENVRVQLPREVAEFVFVGRKEEVELRRGKAGSGCGLCVDLRVFRLFSSPHVVKAGVEKQFGNRRGVEKGQGSGKNRLWSVSASMEEVVGLENSSVPVGGPRTVPGAASEGSSASSGGLDVRKRGRSSLLSMEQGVQRKRLLVRRNSSENNKDEGDDSLARHQASEARKISGDARLESVAGVVMTSRPQGDSRHMRNISGASILSTPSILLESDQDHDTNLGAYGTIVSVFPRIAERPLGSEVIPWHAFSDVIETLESLACQIPVLMHNVAEFLSVKDIVSLISCSRTLLSSLQGCSLRLDRMKHVFCIEELENILCNGEFMRSNNDGDDEMFEVGEEKVMRWTVTGVRFQPCEDMSRFWNLVDGKFLRKLILAGNVDCFDTSALRNCYDLVSFDAGVQCTKLQHHAHLNLLGSLTHLYLRNTLNITSASFIPNTSHLKELSLYMCKKLESIEALSFCANLQVLDLGGCKNLLTVEPLGHCTSLERLSVADCKEILTVDVFRNLQKLNHLDVSGCYKVKDLMVLVELPKLQKLKLKRCAAEPMLRLLEAPSDLLSFEATSNLLRYRLDDLDLLVVNFVQSLSEDNVAAERPVFVENVLSIFSAFAYREGLRSSTALVDRGTVPVLLHIIQNARTPEAIRKLCFEVLARMSQTKEAVQEISRHKTTRCVVDTISAVVNQDTLMSHHVRDMMQYCASTLLFIAAVEEERDRMLQETPNLLHYLVKLLQIGIQETIAEAAGAIWNLAASLDIGKVIASTPDAVSSLAHILRTGSVASKIQAAGALRNLSILDENKLILSENGVLEPIVQLICSRASSTELMSWSSEEMTVLTIKVTATLRIMSTKDEIQLKAGRLGVIPALVSLLRDSDGALRRQVCGALLALSFHAHNRVALLQANAIQDFVRIVDLSSNDSMVVSAAGCLWNLAMHEGVEFEIVRHFRAIPALIRRLDSSNDEIVCRVAGALRSLAYSEAHKELVAEHGGIPKLIALLASVNSRAKTQALAAIRLIASGSRKTRAALVDAGILGKLADLARSGKNDVVLLALSTLVHLAPFYALQIAGVLQVPELVKLADSVPRSSPGRDDLKYILQRIAMAGAGEEAAIKVEKETITAFWEKDLVGIHRVRGVPGDIRISGFEKTSIEFYSYATVAAHDHFIMQGQVFFEVEILKASDSPSIGWISPSFDVGRDYLSDYGVGYPARDPLLQESWAIDGFNQRTWPGKVDFGKKWESGDVLTVAADLDDGTIIYGLNGSFEPPMGVAFSDLKRKAPLFGHGIAPAISASHGTRLWVNFGQTSFKFTPPDSRFLPFSRV